jgi:Holliday junction resolvase-like predicted endonuclease
MTEPLASSASEASLLPVDPKSVDKLWLAALPYIAKSHRRSDLEVPFDLLANLTWRKKQLWLLVDNEEITGAGITAMYPIAAGAKMCKIEHFAADGGISRWLRMSISEIERYAKAEGCDRVLFEARLGWQKYLEDYEVIAVTMEKRLAHG